MWTSPVLFSPPLCSQPGNKLNFSFWLSIPCPSPFKSMLGCGPRHAKSFFKIQLCQHCLTGDGVGRTCVAKETEVKFVDRWIDFEDI